MGADSLEWAAGFLAGLGADFRVVRPDELRAQLGELGARLARASC
jgi:predicted DNA-binding transcriptional regulator YafY